MYVESCLRAVRRNAEETISWEIAYEVVWREGAIAAEGLNLAKIIFGCGEVPAEYLYM